MIQLKNVQKYFNRGKQNEIHAINDTSLDLPDVGMVAIFGKSGCGKTTLLNVIGGLDTFQSGEIIIQGEVLNQKNDDLRNRYIGYIFQNYNLNKNVSCFENVADSLRLCGITDEEFIEKNVLIALKNVGMEGYRNRLPNTLSGGQQQRIAIARAIVKNPSIILADEPTGNLDETNTLMIMKLLKKISKNHLVLLVTHEANLVDFFCDQVIEISDGKIIDIRTNETSSGYQGKNKHDIYLDELSKVEEETNHIKIEYYGNDIDNKIHMKIVSYQGKVYLQLHDSRVSVLDESSEIKLVQKKYVLEESEEIDESLLEDLPIIKTNSYGKLFHFKTEALNFLKNLVKERKKSRTILAMSLAIVTLVIVLVTSIFSIGISDLIHASESYNHQTYYLYLLNNEISDQFQALASDPNSCIDDYWVYDRSFYGDSWLVFNCDYYETTSTSSIETHGVFLDLNSVRNPKVLAGSLDNLKDYQVVLSKRSADDLIKKSDIPFITGYNDLIGLKNNNYKVNGDRLQIGAIIDENEPAFYLSTIAMAKLVMEEKPLNNVSRASDFGYQLKKGESILFYFDQSMKEIPEEITIEGVQTKVLEAKVFYPTYQSYLEANHIEKQEEKAFLATLFLQKYPNISITDPNYETLSNEIYQEHYFDFCDYYYEYLDDYLKQIYQLPIIYSTQSFDSWLYFNKNLEIGKFDSISNPKYYSGYLYKQTYGVYPRLDDKNFLEFEDDHNFFSSYQEIKIAYDNEYSRVISSCFARYNCLVSDEDYLSIAKSTGVTNVNFARYVIDNNTDLYGYALIHSTNPSKTESMIKEHFESYLDVEMENMFVTPKQIFHSLIIDKIESIIGSLITLFVLYVFMALYMYFIMRSSLMSQIKDLGMYRAIGVTKKNLLYKFFIDNFVLITCSEFTTWLFISLIINYNCNRLDLSPTIMYYPVWLSFVVLLLLYLISFIFGMIPIFTLLRKTPSEILSKYDI